MNPLDIPSDAHGPVVDPFSPLDSQISIDLTLPSPASGLSIDSRQTDSRSNSPTTRSSRPVEELRSYTRPKPPRYYAELQKISQIADPYAPSEKSSPLSSPKSQRKTGSRVSVLESSSSSQRYSSGLSEPPLTTSSLPEPDSRAPSRKVTKKLVKKRQHSLQLDSLDSPAAKQDFMAMCKVMGRNLWRRKRV